MNEKIYVVTAIDYGESCDGKARVLGAFKFEGDAKNFVRNDMEDMVDNLMGGADEVDFDQMFVRNDDFTCEWNIEVAEVK